VLEKILFNLYEIAPGLHDVLSHVLEDSAKKFTNSKLENQDVFIVIVTVRKIEVAYFHLFGMHSWV
jgi:hypothetical protein